jgi:chromosome segregation ATPase
MAKLTRVEKEAEAIKKLDASALLAQERITAAAVAAQKMIDDACTVATNALEMNARIPDKRNIDGSYQWDRGDRYRRGSDDRLQRIEDKVNGEKDQIGDLEVGQAKREEQIAGLIEDCSGLKENIRQLRDSFNTMNKEQDSRMTGLRELSLEVRDTLTNKINEVNERLIKEISDYKARNLWQLVLIMATAITTVMFVILNHYVFI